VLKHCYSRKHLGYKQIKVSTVIKKERKKSYLVTTVLVAISFVWINDESKTFISQDEPVNVQGNSDLCSLVNLVIIVSEIVFSF
jgi:hypothetical protein